MSGNTVRSVERAIRLLLSFSAEQPELSLVELARSVDLSPSTTHRLLNTLTEFGFAQQIGQGGKYQPGLALFRLGALVQQGLTLHKQSQLPLRRLARSTGETAYLCVVDCHQALCVDRVEGTNQVRVLAVDVGGYLPLNAGAAPRALLAFLPDDQIQALFELRQLRRLNSRTLIAPDEIWHDVHLTRQRGYTISQEDVVHDVVAVGAPVRDHTGAVVAAVSVAGIRSRFDGGRLDDLVQNVCAEAATISRNLGWSERASMPDTHSS